MSSIQKVAVLAASGNLGRSIVPSLLQSGFTVTVISRPGARGYTPSADDSSTSAQAVETRAAPYNDIAGLTAALRDQDALVEAFNTAAAVHQRIIVHTALAAGMKHLVTSEFGLGTFHPNAAQLPASEVKIQAQRTVEEELQEAVAGDNLTPLTWTGIFEGTCAQRGGGGCCATRAGALPEPPAYFASHTVMTNDLIALVKEVSEDPEKPWNVEDDAKKGVEGQLHTGAFLTLAAAAIFDENNHFGADFGKKLEPGWDEGREKLKDHLKLLIKETAG